MSFALIPVSLRINKSPLFILALTPWRYPRPRPWSWVKDHAEQHSFGCVDHDR